MKDAPELHGLFDGVTSFVSDAASSIADKAGDVGSFASRKASDAYDFVGDRKDELASGLYEWGGDIKDLPGKFGSGIYKGVGDFTDDPFGSTYRSAGRFVDNSLAVQSSVASITKNVIQGDFRESGKNFAVLAERATMTLPVGVDSVASIASISPISQNREMTGTGMSIMGPIIAGVLASKAGEAIGNSDSPNVDTSNVPSVDLSKAKEAYSTGKEAYNEVDSAISNAKDTQREIERNYQDASNQLQAAKEDARNSLPETQYEIAQLKQELAASKEKADDAARKLAQAIAISPEAAKQALAEYNRAAKAFDNSLSLASGEEPSSAGNLVLLGIAATGLYLILKS